MHAFGELRELAAQDLRGKVGKKAGLELGASAIHADFVGRKVPTSASEVIKVSFESTDGISNVEILDRPAMA